MRDAPTQCADCRTCPIYERCREICEATETLLPSMEQGRVDFEDLPRIYEGRIVTSLILDHEEILTEHQRLVVQLYYRESMQQEEIGRALNVTQQAVSDTLKSVREHFMRMYLKRARFEKKESESQSEQKPAAE